MEYNFLLKTKELMNDCEEKERQTKFFRDWKNEFFVPKIAGDSFFVQNCEEEFNFLQKHINMYLNMIEYVQKEFTLKEGNRILSSHRSPVYEHINGFVRTLERKMTERITNKYDLEHDLQLSKLAEMIDYEYPHLDDHFVYTTFYRLVKNNTIREEMSVQEILNVLRKYIDDNAYKN